MNLKLSLFHLARKLGGHRLPARIKVPIGDKLSLREDGRNIFIEQRRDNTANLMCKVLHLEGDIIECGVNHGYTTEKLGLKLKEVKSNKTIYGIDVFDKFPFDDNDFSYKQDKLIKKKFTKATGEDIPSIETVQKMFDEKGLDNIELIKGLVGDILPTLADKKFCFASVDVDSYLATKQCITFFKDHLVEGGMLFMDDYNTPGWEGATQAANELLGKKNIVKLPHIQAYWIKPDI